jgi:ABC-type multidrug transport system fused ATPase/permease subunit
MSAVLSVCRVGVAIITKSLIDASVDGVWKGAIQACIYFGFAILLQIGLKAVISVLSIRTYEDLSNKLRNKLFLHLSKVKWTEYSKYHSGDILTRATSDVGIIVDGIVNVIPEIISLGFGLLASFVTLLIFDPVLAVYAFLLGPIALLISYLFGKRFMNMVEKAQEAESIYRSYLQECLEHMLIIKTFCYEKESGKQISQLQEDKKRLAIRKNHATVISSSLVAGGFWFSYLLAFGWGAMRLFHGTITFGTLTAFLQLVGQIQSPFLGLAGTLPQVISMAASSKRLIELEQLETETQHKVEFDIDRGINDITIKDITLEDITLEEVDFAYTQNNPVLRNVTAKIQEGEIIGLIGMSGEGKTTLLHLVMQLLEPVEGKISYHNGKNMNYLAEGSIRALISYVPQGNTLFSGTISYNLRIGGPEATVEDIIVALKGADAWEFVEKLPDGLNTVIGERGLGLSEGQAQRIAIARALLRKTPILLLDEATSALDTATERKVLQTITELSPRRTCIIISHRPSILDYCQRIWNLTNGKLVEVTEINEAAASEAM